MGRSKSHARKLGPPKKERVSPRAAQRRERQSAADRRALDPQPARPRDERTEHDLGVIRRDLPALCRGVASILDRLEAPMEVLR
ncbi:MAG: hypothetical protein ACYCTE_06770 [Acidimicrobiales bacterium]